MGLSLLPLDFSFILPVVSILLQLYCTDSKTSRLMVKRLSTVRDTREVHRVTLKEEREEGDKDEQEEKKKKKEK